MNLFSVAVLLVLLAGVWAQINVVRPECDSPEAEEAALVFQDYLNNQHTHGYKYAVNRIEDIKIYTKPDGDNTYAMEIDLLETDCHVLDPTPVANCTVRPKTLTAIEGDCDVVLKKVGGAFTVTAFKCKSEESTEDMCLGCPILLPLNDTTALDFVHTSLATFNNMTTNTTFIVLEVGRMSTQLVSGGPIFIAEYVVVEANCTENLCVPLDDAMAGRGICSARGLTAAHTIDCKMFPTLMTVVDANSTVVRASLPTIHVHTGNLTRNHGLKHHRLTPLHDPHQTGLLSAESAESTEAGPIAFAVDAVAAAVDPAADPAPADPAPADPASASDSTSASDAPRSHELPFNFRKRDLSAIVADTPPAQTEPLLLVPVCPGKVRFF